VFLNETLVRPCLAKCKTPSLLNKQVRDSLLGESLPRLYAPNQGFGGLGGFKRYRDFMSGPYKVEWVWYSNSIPKREDVSQRCLAICGFVCD